MKAGSKNMNHARSKPIQVKISLNKFLSTGIVSNLGSGLRQKTLTPPSNNNK